MEYSKEDLQDSLKRRLTLLIEYHHRQRKEMILNIIHKQNDVIGEISQLNSSFNHIQTKLFFTESKDSEREELVSKIRTVATEVADLLRRVHLRLDNIEEKLGTKSVADQSYCI